MPAKMQRPTRKSSRTSSPFPPNANSNSSPAPGLAPKKEKAQTFLDGWVEPPPKNPIASFEEHGFARHGVLENMAPLGQPPTAKMKAKLRGGPEMQRHSLLSRNGNLSTGEDALSTPEMTPAAEPERTETEPPEEEDAVLPPSIEPQDEDEDDEYIPNGVRSASRSGKAGMRNGVKAVTPHRDAIIPPTSVTPTTRTPAGNQIMLKAVNAAMKKAHDDGRPAVGEAVRRLYDDSCHNQNYARLLDAILNERATPQEQLDFRIYIKSVKKAAKARNRQLLRARTNSLHGSPAAHAKTRNSSPPARPADTIATTIAAVPTTPSIYTIVPQPSISVPSHSNPLSNVPHLSPTLPSNHNNNIFATSSRPASPPAQFATNGNLPKHPEMVSTRRQGRAAAPPQDATPALVPAPVPAPAKQPAAKAPKPPVKPKGKAAKVTTKTGLETSDSELSDVNEDIITESQKSIAKELDGLAAPPKVSKPKLILKNNPKGKKPKSGTSTPAPMSAGGKRSADEAGIDEEEQEKILQVSKPSSSKAAARRSGWSRNGASQPSQPAPNAATPQQNGVKAQTTTPDVATPVDGTPGAVPQGAATPRRAGTARPVTRPTTPAAAPAAKRRKPNKGPAKTKFSPVKGKGKAAVASTARAVAGSSSAPVLIGADNTETDGDDDVCAACSEGGEIIGCDHCEDWYHFKCAEPPIPEGMDPPDDFMCHKCRRLSAAAEASSAINPKWKIIKCLETAIPAPELGPRWFMLPEDIRNYFEGVTTNAEGGYVEAPAREIALQKDKGYFARPDPFKLMDHGKAILCHACSRSATGKRDIIKCDFCPKYWHLDCLNPPAAISPVVITVSGMTRRAWKCPLHVDHDLKIAPKIDTPTFNGSIKRKRGSDEEGEAATMFVRHRIRLPKILTPQDVALPRGARNSGIIDVVGNEDESDDDEDWVYDDQTPRPEDAVLKKIPKQTIIADFLDSVKRRRLDEGTVSARIISKHQGRAPARAMSSRSIIEQQAALNLAQFAEREAEIGLTAENVTALVGSLIAEAPAGVVALVAGEETAGERALLEKLQVLISAKLNGTGGTASS